MRDKSGREYLKQTDVKPGLIELDSSFSCHCGGITMLYPYPDGTLYFYCDSGKHDISGQLEEEPKGGNAYYVGMYSCSANPDQ